MMNNNETIGTVHTHTHTHGDLKESRIKWIDIARGIGIIFIVLGHILEDGYLRKVLFFFHVPLFFFISGLTFKRKKNNKTFIKEKLKNLYVPYLIVSIISIFIYLLMGSFIGENVGFNLKDFLINVLGMLYANSILDNMVWNRPLWFIPAFIITLIITNMLEAINNKKIKNILVIFLTGVGMILSYCKIYLPFQTETALSMIIWIYLGINTKQIFLKVNKKSFLILGAIVSTIIGIVIGSINGKVSIRTDYYGNNILLYYISATLLIISTCFASILINENKYLEYIGQSTLYILLWHKFPILFFQKLCPIVKDILVSNNEIIKDISAIIINVPIIIMCIVFHKCIIYFLKNKKNNNKETEI